MEGDMRESKQHKQHIVLVHGACHGAWCWYKVSTMLRRAGHRVTVPDLSASGIDERRPHEVLTLADYSQPLMDIMASLAPGEKVILVGHSYGGLNLALAMDRYPDKIAVAVFATAYMPDSTSSPSYVLEQIRIIPRSWWMDTKFGYDDGPEKPPTSILFGPQFMSSKLYHLCSPEDLTLATTLVRAKPSFQGTLSREPPFSEERYGSVDRVYIVCGQDASITEDFQLWMIKNYPVKEVIEIKGADHMVMLSMPHELCQCLLAIADTYA